MFGTYTTALFDVQLKHRNTFLTVSLFNVNRGLFAAGGDLEAAARSACLLLYLTVILRQTLHLDLAADQHDPVGCADPY